MVTRQLNMVDALAQLAFLVHGALERRAAEHDVSITQTRLLGVLRDREPTMNELATLLGLDKSSVTGLVDRAERRDLVARTPSPDDGRSYRVQLTRAGRVVVAAVTKAFESDVRAFLRAMPTDDRTTLSQLAGRVVVAHAAERGIELFPPKA